MMKYTICGIQMETGKEPEKNVEKLLDLCTKAIVQKPDFIVIPEMFEIVPKLNLADQYAHPVPSAITQTISGFAKEHSVNIIGGTLFEKDEENVYNTCCVFDRSGSLIGRYRKMHLFDAFGYGESEWIARGESPLLCELEGLKFGIAICYDIRFPELFRYYATNGASIVFVPSAFFQPNHDHWTLSIRSRALENTIFVMGCNQTGKHFVGRSMLADPWGIQAVSLGVEEGVLVCHVQLDLIEKTRKKLPVLNNRRFDVLISD